MSTNVEGNKLNPCSLKSLGDVQGEAKETYHQKEHKDALKDVVYKQSVDRASV